MMYFRHEYSFRMPSQQSYLLFRLYEAEIVFYGLELCVYNVERNYISPRNISYITNAVNNIHFHQLLKHLNGIVDKDFVQFVEEDEIITSTDNFYFIALRKIVERSKEL